MPAEIIFWRTMIFFICIVALYVMAWRITAQRLVGDGKRYLLVAQFCIFVPAFAHHLLNSNSRHGPPFVDVLGNSWLVFVLLLLSVAFPTVWLILWTRGLADRVPGLRVLAFCVLLGFVGVGGSYLVDLRTNHARTLDDPASAALLDVVKRVESGEAFGYLPIATYPESKRKSVNEILTTRKKACKVADSPTYEWIERVAYEPHISLLRKKIRGYINVDGEERLSTHTLIGYPECWFVIEATFGRNEVGNVALRDFRLGDTFTNREFALRDESSLYRRIWIGPKYESALIRRFD